MRGIIVFLLLACFFSLNVLAVNLSKQKIIYSCDNGVDIQAALDSGGLRIDN